MFKLFKKKNTAVSDFVNYIPEHSCDIKESLMVLPVTDGVILSGESEKNRAKNSHYYDWTTIQEVLAHSPQCPFRTQYTGTNSVSRTLTQYVTDLDLLKEITAWVVGHLDTMQAEELTEYASSFFNTCCQMDAPLEAIRVLFQQFSEKQHCVLFAKALQGKSVLEQKNLWVKFCSVAIQRRQLDWLALACLFLNENAGLKQKFRVDGGWFEFNDSRGRSLLMQAAIIGSVDACEILSVFKQNINQTYQSTDTANVETALSYAVMSNQMAVFEWLRARQAMLFVPNQGVRENSIYCRALTQHNAAFLRVLLKQSDGSCLPALKYALNFSMSQKLYECAPDLFEKVLGLPRPKISSGCLPGRGGRIAPEAVWDDLDSENATFLMRLAKTGNIGLFLDLLKKASAYEVSLNVMHVRNQGSLAGEEQTSIIHDVVRNLDVACLQAVYEQVKAPSRSGFLNQPAIYVYGQCLAIDIAVRRNKEEIVDWLIAHQTEVSCFSENSRVSTLNTALQYASERIIAALLDYYREKNIAIDEGVIDKKTLLLLLDNVKYANTLSLLLDAGLAIAEVDWNVKRRSDNHKELIQVPLLLAAVKKQPKAVIEKMLLLPQLKIDEESLYVYSDLYKECNPIYLAAKYNSDPDVSELLYKKKRFLRKKLDHDHSTYFSWWVQRGKTAFVNAALRDYRSEIVVEEDASEGAVVHRAAGPDDWTALHVAAYQGTIAELSRVYEAYPTALNQTAGFYLTPLVVAVFGKQKDNAKFLIDRGADFTVTDYADQNLLHACARSDEAAEIVEYLAARCDEETLQLLLEAESVYENTPLTIAYFCRNTAVFVALLRLTKKLRSDAVVVTKIIEDGNLKYAELLLKHGQLSMGTPKRLEELIRFGTFFVHVTASYKACYSQLDAIVIDRYQRLVLAIEHILTHKAQYIADPNALVNQTHIQIAGQDVVIHFEYNVFSERGNLSLEAYFESLFVTLKTHYELYLAHRDALSWFKNLPEGLCIDARINTLAEDIEVLRAHARPTVDRLITEAWLADVSQEAESEQAKQDRVISDVLARYVGQEVIFSEPHAQEEVILANDAGTHARLRARLLSFIN